MAVSPWVITPVSAQGVWNLDNPLLRPLFRWDAGWYLSVAKNGYSFDGNLKRQQNIAFFPLYPLTCRFCHGATGFSIPVCGVLLSHLALFIGLAALYRLIVREVGPEVARSALLLLAFFPASFFFSTMYAESFFLAFSVLAFAAFRRQRFIQGGIWAALASATRRTGILLVVPLVFEGYSCLRDRRKVTAVALAALLTVSGIGLFFLYSWIAFGDPLVPIKIHQAPGWRGGLALPFRSIALGFKQTFQASYSSLPFDAWFGLLFIALTCVPHSQLPRSYALYGLLSLAMPLFTEGGVWSMIRHVNVTFPGFVALGIIAQRSRWIPWVLLPVFTVTLVYLSMRFAQWYLVG